MKMWAKVAGIVGQALAVTFGIWIAALNAQTERAEDTFRSFQFVSKFFQFQQRLDSGEEFFRKDRLIEKVVSACLNSAHPVFAFAETGDQNKWDQPRRRILIQLMAEFVTRFAGHDNIRENQIGRVPQDFAFRLQRVRNRNHVVPTRGE